MAVLNIEKYRQKDGTDILKVILKPTKVYPEGYFYCDVSDEELVRQYTWFLMNQRQPYIVAHFGGRDSRQTLRFHREKAYNILEKYPSYINHLDGIEYDNVNMNLDKVTNQQNIWCKPSRGYKLAGRSFVPSIMVNFRNIYAKCTRTEVEACEVAHQLELQYEDYCYDFFKDRRKDADILDLERTGQISEDEAIYRHVLRYADNAWYYYRYNLAEYFANNHLKVPAFSTDSDGYMTHLVTGQRLCPM